MDVTEADLADELADYHRKYAKRVPLGLSDLCGPSQGLIEPPFTVVWSGLRVFDLSDPRQRLSLYRNVLAEGMREDICALLNRRLLEEQWPLLRRVLVPAARRVWERRFPELAALPEMTRPAFLDAAA
ncbi:hypothetical protein SRB5_46450 [Streptomyces sp. RB5]|uniref:Uncharacterized protein n=1 Tax=Streptomyces smaragdinus TaxID=2585196 RepID=A0A7K0CLW2_9ACTN|nr:hypothetical protein [Streptomyces smaragdinus]MQY14478.1 hypothetical protein [Streptomyces smaragdinus]